MISAWIPRYAKQSAVMQGYFAATRVTSAVTAPRHRGDEAGKRAINSQSIESVHPLVDTPYRWRKGA